MDTRCASLGEGFLVREALRKQAEGLSLEELVQWIEDYQPQVCQWFTVDTFEHLKHGGRVSSAAAVLGTALQIKPLLHVSLTGELEVVDRTIRGTKRAISALLARMEKGWQPHYHWARRVSGHGGLLCEGASNTVSSGGADHRTHRAGDWFPHRAGPPCLCILGNGTVKESGNAICVRALFMPDSFLPC